MSIVKKVSLFRAWMLVIGFSSISLLFAQGTQGTFYFLMDGPSRPTLSSYPTVFPANLVTPFSIRVEDSYNTPSGRRALADAAKVYLNALPDNRRCLFLWCYSHNPNLYTTYLEGTGEAGVANVTAMWDDFFSYYKSIGGKVDYIGMDFEGPYDEWDQPGPLTTSMKIHRSTFHPAQKYYPDILMGSYDNWIIDNYIPYSGATPKYGVVNDYGDIQPWFNTLDYDTTYGLMGNVNNPASYGWAMNNLPGKLGGATPFKVFYHDMVKLAGMRLCTPSIKVVPYFAWPTWNNGHWEGSGSLAYGPNVATQTHYWREEIAHGFMNTGLDFAEMFVVVPDGNTVTDTNMTMSRSCIILQTMILHELEEVIGYPDRQPLVKVLPSMDYPNMHYYLSGIYAGGKNVWRITPDSAAVSRAAFKTSDNPITFKVGTTTIVFPTGSAILVPTRKYTQIGYWVTSPYNTSPTINGTAYPIQAVDTTLPHQYPTQSVINPEKPNVQTKSSFIGQPVENSLGGVSLPCNFPVQTRVSFEILNAAGQKVSSAGNTTIAAGAQTLVWDGTNSAGKQSKTGVYFAKVNVANTDIVRKIVLKK